MGGTLRFVTFGVLHFPARIAGRLGPVFSLDSTAQLFKADLLPFWFSLFGLFLVGVSKG